MIRYIDDANLQLMLMNIEMIEVIKQIKKNNLIKIADSYRLRIHNNLDDVDVYEYSSFTYDILSVDKIDFESIYIDLDDEGYACIRNIDSINNILSLFDIEIITYENYQYDDEGTDIGELLVLSNEITKKYCNTFSKTTLEDISLKALSIINQSISLSDIMAFGTTDVLNNNIVIKDGKVLIIYSLETSASGILKAYNYILKTMKNKIDNMEEK